MVYAPGPLSLPPAVSLGGVEAGGGGSGIIHATVATVAHSSTHQTGASSSSFISFLAFVRVDNSSTIEALWAAECERC